MDSEHALALLGAKAHQDRLKGISYIRNALHPQQMLIHNAVGSTQSLPELLKAIAQTLADANWNVKREAVALASELLPANAVAANYLLANLLVSLSDSKVTIRKSATAAISKWLAAAKDADKAFELLDKRGLQNQNPQVRAEVLGFLQSDQCLYTTPQPGLTRLLAGVTKRILDSDEDVKFAARQTIQAVSQSADPSVLEAAVQQLPSGLRQRYLDTHATITQESPTHPSQRAGAQSTAITRPPPAPQQRQQLQQQQHKGQPAPGAGPGASMLVFGCIPDHLVQTVRSSDNMQGRVRALGEIHRHLEALETGTHVLPYLQPLLELLTTLMQDVNLKVIVGAMEATGVLVRKLGWPVRNHLDLLVNKLAVLLGDSKIVVRQSAARLLNRLMHTLTPAPVLHILLKHLEADGWRVREEVINIVIVAMSTFMPDRFDFERLAALLMPGLRDKRSRIKFVTIEAFAVMASIIGQPRLQQLLSSYSLDSATRQSLQERLEAANELPSITDDGMVHHTNLQETSDSRVGSTMSQPLASSAGLSRMPWLATPDSRGDQTLSSLSSKAASASSINTTVRNTIRSVSGEGDDGGDTVSAPSTASSAASTNSYARMHRNKLAGTSTASSSYASWARRSKKLKHSNGNNSGYSMSSQPESFVAGVSASSITSTPTSMGPSKTQGKSRKKIPFVESRMARPTSSSSSSAEPLSGLSSTTVSRQGSTVHAHASGTGAGRRKAGSYVAAHSPTGGNSNSTSPRTKQHHQPKPKQQQQQQQHLPAPIDSKFARNRSDSRLVVESARNGQASPGTSRSWDPKRHGHSVLDAAADEPDRIELSDPKARHHPTYAPQTIIARRPRRGSYTRTPPTTTPATSTTTAPTAAAATVTAKASGRSNTSSGPAAAEEEAVAIGRHVTRSPGASDEHAATELVDEAAAVKEGAVFGSGDDTESAFKPHPPRNPRQKSDSRFRTSTPIGAVNSKEPTGHEGSHLPTFGFKQQQQEHEQEKARQRIAEAKRREQERQQREQQELEREEAERLEREREFQEKAKERRRREKERIQRERERRLREKAEEEEREQKEREEREERLKRLDEQRRQQRQKQQEARKQQQQQQQEEEDEQSRKQEEEEEEQKEREEREERLKRLDKQRRQQRQKQQEARKQQQQQQEEAEEEQRRKQREEEEEAAAAELREQEKREKQQQEKERQAHAPRKRPPRPPSHIAVEEDGAQPRVPQVQEYDDATERAGSTLSVPEPSAAPSAVGDIGAKRQQQQQGSGSASTAATPRKQQQRATTGRSVPSSMARTRGRARTGAKSTRGGGKASANDPYLVDIDMLDPPSGSADAAWKQAQQSLQKGNSQELWIEKCEGLSMIRRLILHQPESVVGVLGDVVRNVLQEVKNLRSAVSRLAILACGDLCRLLGKPTEKHVDDIVTAVLLKAGGEASSFIKEDAEAALLDVVDALSPYKIIGALLPHTGHKNREIRRMSAKLLVPVLQRTGAKILSHREAPRLMRRLAQLVTDGDQEARYYGRLLANEVMAFDGYEKAIQRHVEGRPQRELLDACEMVQKKGVGAPPMAATHRGAVSSMGGGASASTASGGAARHTSRVSTRKASTSSTGSADASTASVGARSASTSTSATPQRRTAAGARARQKSAVHSATPFKTAKGDDLLGLLGKDLKSSDWKTREATIAKLRDLVLKSPEKFVGSATNVFFDFAARLQDTNSKVNVSALRALLEMLPLLPDALDMVMAELLSSLTMGLASKNSNINGLTREAMKLVVTGVNPSHVTQPLMTTLLNANSVIREALLPYLAQFVPLATQSNPKLVQKHVVGGCIKLLSDNKLSPKTAPVWVALHNEFGDALFKRKAFTPAVTAQVQKLL